MIPPIGRYSAAEGLPPYDNYQTRDFVVQVGKPTFCDLAHYGPLGPATNDAELDEIFSPIAKDLHGYAQAIDTEPREDAVREPSRIDELRPQPLLPPLPPFQLPFVFSVHPHTHSDSPCSAPVPFYSPKPTATRPLGSYPQPKQARLLTMMNFCRSPRTVHYHLRPEA